MMNNTNTPAKHDLSAQLHEANALALRIRTLNEAAAYIAREANGDDALEKVDMLSGIAESAAYFTEKLQERLDAMGSQAH